MRLAPLRHCGPPQLATEPGPGQTPFTPLIAALDAQFPRLFGHAHHVMRQSIMFLRVVAGILFRSSKGAFMSRCDALKQ